MPLLSDPIYTIGHSDHLIENFVELLIRHDITAVCDVRSVPYSRRNPQFNREPLRNELRYHGVEYIFLGEELGARTKDPSCYRNGKVQYGLLSQTTLFRRGLERVRKGLEKFRIALMCAEKDPIQCHRTILVARNLMAEGVPVRHILSTGEIQSQEQVEERLLDSLNMSSSDLFRSRDEMIRDAYRMQGNAIAIQLISDESDG